MHKPIKPGLILIAAMSKNKVIGINNKLPWSLPEDLHRFKQLTTGQVVAMGRKTWESLPIQPLPNRRNLIITREVGYAAQAEVVSSLDTVYTLSHQIPVFIIGGSEIYRQCLPQASRLEITEIDADFEGDTYFPPIDLNVWLVQDKSEHVSSSGLNFSFVSYCRKLN